MFAKKITVNFINRDGYQGNCKGILIDEETAIYIGAESGEVYLGSVLPTDEQGQYLVDWSMKIDYLGFPNGNHDEALAAIESVVLQKMSAVESKQPKELIMHD